MMETTDRYLIAGLGNPGSRYKHTRHNFGFMVLDELAERLDSPFKRLQHMALISKANHGQKSILLAKPRTYMNNSGNSIAALARYYKIPLQNILVCFDDVDLEFDVIRLRQEGGSSGQKGMASIIQALGSQQFPRMRLGLGRPQGRLETSDYVLLPFTRQEAEMLPLIIERAADAVITFVEEGIEAAMNKYNTRS